MRVWVQILFVILCGTLVACSMTGNVVKEQIPYEEGSIEVYFCPKDDCAKVVVDFISTGQDVKCAFYDLTHEEIRAALQAVDAEVAVDDEEHEGLGVPVKAKGIMHDKFCIVNGSVVLTGSFNPTSKGTEHRNNVVIVHSIYLAENYLDEFEELAGNVVQSKKTQVKHASINLSGKLIENYFCPEDSCEEEVLEELSKAKESVHFMTYSFTSDAIGDALVQLWNQGVEVQGVFEPQQLSQWSEHDKLESAGILVFVDEEKWLMHNKVFVIDEKVVITGSYNPTKNADENNDENILIVHNEKVAGEYVEEYNERFKKDS